MNLRLAYLVSRRVDGVVRRLAGAIILNVSHGYQVTEGDDKMIMLADKLMDEFSKVTTPGTHLVDIIPARTSGFNVFLDHA